MIIKAGIADLTVKGKSMPLQSTRPYSEWPPGKRYFACSGFAGINVTFKLQPQHRWWSGYRYHSTLSRHGHQGCTVESYYCRSGPKAYMQLNTGFHLHCIFPVGSSDITHCHCTTSDYRSSPRTGYIAEIH